MSFDLKSHHRFSHPHSPHPLLYLGADAGVCLWERFGDAMYDGCLTLPSALWADSVLSAIHVPELRLCDLTEGRTCAAMTVDTAALLSHDLSVPQAWGLAIQRHPARFQAIRYPSRFNPKQACLALFDLDNLAGRLTEKTLGALSDLPATTAWLNDLKVILI